MDRIGVVAIGRNEGARLRRCLQSVVDRVAAVVYVDSGSTDGSVQAARELGVDVVALDLSIPFTAARARNAGFARLRSLVPDVEFVQFVDGDCEVDAEWLPTAAAALANDPQLAGVCGRRRERFPEQTVFNRLCDLEWDTPVGETKSCGGDALLRVAALVEVGGYDDTLIAGEEPELCVRLRERGWRIRRLPAEMTLHDAAMTEWRQWWKRSVRAGHAYAEGAARHGRPPERHWVREVRSNWFWGAAVPAVVLAFAWPTHGASMLLLGGYVVLAWRVWQHARRRRFSAVDAATYAWFTVLGKFPQTVGQLQFHWNRFVGRRSRLIEYKGAAA
jgi:glycosyltransferase involved in cell wall biosynthesis